VLRCDTDSELLREFLYYADFICEGNGEDDFCGELVHQVVSGTKIKKTTRPIGEDVGRKPVEYGIVQDGFVTLYARQGIIEERI
jgi:hypothetical protein